MVGTLLVATSRTLSVLSVAITPHDSPEQPRKDSHTDNIYHYILPIHIANIQLFLVVYNTLPTISQRHNQVGIIYILLREDIYHLQLRLIPSLLGRNHI